jgi:hypothetical protein
MLWMTIALILGALALIAAMTAFWGRISGRSNSSALTVRIGDAPVSYFGLPPDDAEKLEQSARTAGRRERNRWMSDYRADSPAPGRIAGIPSTLRVRR